MLTITILGDEVFDEATSEIYTEGDVVVELEHSLVSLSKWEEIHEKPFLSKQEKSFEEIMSYIQCMILTPDVTPETFSRLTQSNIDQIQRHIDAKRTATWFNERNIPTNTSSEVITNELIYYWLTVAEIPWQPIETWHLNRLFTTLKIFNVKNAKPVKRGPAEMGADRKAENARRKAMFKTRG